MADAMTTFRTTLLRLANEQDAPERVRLSGLLASELDVAFNRQGNQNQLALSDTEEVLLKKIDGLQKDVGDNNILIATFLETFPAQFTTFQRDMRAAVEETAQSIKKEMSDLRDSHSTIIDRLDNKRELLADHERRISALEENSARLEALEDAIAALRAASVVERDEAVGDDER